MVWFGDEFLGMRCFLSLLQSLFSSYFWSKGEDGGAHACGLPILLLAFLIFRQSLVWFYPLLTLGLPLTVAIITTSSSRGAVEESEGTEIERNDHDLDHEGKKRF